MTGQVTSPGLARWIPDEWRAFGAFLRRPALPERMTGIRPAALASVLKLFALDAVLMAIMLGLVGVASAAGVKFPSNEIDSLSLSPLILALIVLAAPIGEELVFRGWLSGRPGPVVAAVALLVGVLVPVVSGPQGHPILLFGSLAMAVLVAVGVLIWLRKRLAFPFFSRHFAWFYFAASLLFALAHLTNYSSGAALILLPLVIPQLLVGLILGYARVTFGLWSDLLLHMLHNGVLISLIVLQKGL